MLPGVGSLLSVLFGTATQGNLNKLKRVVKNLGSNQDQLVHVVENSISALNITHEAAAENRQSINLLRNATVEFHSTLSALIRKMSKLQAEISYLEVITSIHGFTHVITLVMQKAKWELEKLMQIITDVAKGQISMVWLKPSNLLALLKDVQKHLPDDMSFPFLLNPSGIWRYYRNLQPFMIPDNQKLHVVLALPVVHHNSRYDLIQAISLPVPASNVSLSASHKLESEYFIISPQKEWYALMKEEDVAHCDSYLGCKYTGPLYNVKNSPACTIALYLEQKLSGKPVVPVVKQLSPNHWVIIAPFPLTLHIVCDKTDPKLSSIKLPTGLNLLPISWECSAYSKYFKILQPVEGKSNINVTVPHLSDIQKANMDIWHHAKISEQRLTSLNASIQNMKLLPPLVKVSLAHVLSRLNKVSPDTKEFSVDWANSSPFQIAGFYCIEHFRSCSNCSNDCFNSGI